MATLYELDKQMKYLESFSNGYDFDMDGNMVNLETGEIFSNEEFDKLFESTEIALDKKIENTIAYVKDIKGDIEKFEKEKARLDKSIKQKEKLVQFMLNRVDNYIRYSQTKDGALDEESLHSFKMETPKANVSYRKGYELSILDENLIPKKYLNKKTTVVIKPDKNEIKKVLKEGKKVKGCTYNTKYTMKIN